MPPYIIHHDESQLKAIFKDIDLSHKQLEKDIITLGEWVKSQPHLPQGVLDDVMLAAFITGCKNSLQRAKQSIDRYFTNRTTFPEIYSDRDPLNEELLRSENVFRFFPLPGSTPEGYRVLLASLINPDPDEFSFLALIKRMLSVGDVTLQVEKYHGGIYYVYDMKGLSLKHVTKITPALCKKFLYCGEKTMPLRTKGSLLFNSPSLTETLLNMVKPLMREKTAKRIYVSSGDHTFLYKYIPKEMLPYEYGGQAGHLQDLNRAFLDYAKGYREWFLADAKRHVDESKRPEKAVYKPTEMFGVEGSFKTLSID